MNREKALKLTESYYSKKAPNQKGILKETIKSINKQIKHVAKQGGYSVEWAGMSHYDSDTIFNIRKYYETRGFETEIAEKTFEFIIVKVSWRV